MRFTANVLLARLRRAWFNLWCLVTPEHSLRQLPKIMLHEHLDCSLRPRTMLELMEQVGFPTNFPDNIRDTWLSQGRDSVADAHEREQNRQAATDDYQK
ncbi:MAG TPA: hypothetical protein V6C72_16805, partial [Chroococcales cyanobacterium]